MFLFVNSPHAINAVSFPSQYTPTSIVLTALPQTIAPSENGIIVIQLVNGQGIPEPVSYPVGSTITVDLYSSNPSVISVDPQAKIPYGISHAEVNFTAHGAGTATIMAVANGLNMGTVVITSSAVPSYSLRILLLPLQQFAAPGDVVPVLLQLLAGNTPFITPVPVQAFVATSVPGSNTTTVEIQPGSSFAYFDVTIPNVTFLQVNAVANGFQPNSTIINVVPMGSGPPSLALLASNETVYQSGTTIQLSVSLLSSSSQPVAGPLNVQVSSSNQSVISPLVGSLNITGDSAVFQAQAGAAGTAELTVIAPGITSLPLNIKVVNAYGSRLIVNAPTAVRAGENYSFSAEFISNKGILLPYNGNIVASAYSNATSVLSITTGQLQMSSGYGLGTFVAAGEGFANITAIVNGYQAGLITVASYQSPLVAPVSYEVSLISYSGPLAGVPVNFTYGGTTSVIDTDAAGIAQFTSYNDTPTVVAVPASFVMANKTFYFTGWSNGAKSENISLLSSSSSYSITAQYYRSIVPVTYEVSLISYSGPLAGVPVNFTYRNTTATVLTNTEGMASFASYNGTSTSVSVPASITLGNKTFYFTGWNNGAKSENLSLFSSSSPYSINAQYYRSVVPTTYFVLVLSDGQKPVAGISFNVTSSALKENFTLTTDSKGMAGFILPNGSTFTISLPELFQPSSETRYVFLNIDNSTKNIINITAPPATTTFNAFYATYYTFQVNSPIGTTTGSGWYRTGSSASYSVSETSSGGPLVFQRFAGWTGSFSSSQPSGSVTITSPEFITAQWRTDDTLLFTAAAAVVAAATVIGVFIFRLRKKVMTTT